MRLLTPVVLRMQVGSKDQLQQTQAFFMFLAKQHFLA